MEYVDENYATHSYRIYGYTSGVNLVSGPYKRDVTKYKGPIEEAPIDIYISNEREVLVDTEKLVHQLATQYGEGRLNVYKIGGKPAYESIFQRRFIKKIP